MPRGNRPTLADAVRFTQAGTVLIAPMLGLGALGYWIDGRFGTRPWVMVAGLLLGMGGGFVNFLQLVLPKRRGRGGEPGTSGSGPYHDAGGAGGAGPPADAGSSDDGGSSGDGGDGA